MTIHEILSAGTAEWGLELRPEAMEAFEAYYACLSEYNAIMDLTAVEGEAETARRHFLDSLSLFRFADLHGARIIDVGSGAGFPGIPLMLADPSIDLTLLDAQKKRVEFLAVLCDRLGIKAECVFARAEEEAQKPERRERYDYAVSRAVARLNMLTELCLPFVRAGGEFLAMKARGCEEELEEATDAIRILSGGTARLEQFSVAGTDRALVLIKKTEPTPAGYPRRFARIKKNPL